MFVQKFVPAFAVLGAAMAQTSSVCSNSTITINSQADASALATCTTIKGSIVIGNVTGDLLINGPEVVGGISCTDATELITLSSTSISSIGGAFALSGLTRLSTLSFADLTQVGSINFQALPALGQLTFSSNIGKASSVVISNTFLSSLDGITLTTVGSMDINNNVQLTEFTSNIGNISESLNIAANHASLSVSFPNLTWANDMTFRNVTTLSMPILSVVNDSLTLDESSFTTIIASNLAAIGNTGLRTGGLTIATNDDLTNVTFAKLATIGGSLEIANNTALDFIKFPSLTQVGGAVDVTGEFSTVDLLELKNVEGTLNIQSTKTFDCSTYNKWGDGTVVQASAVCKSATSNPVSSTGSGTSTSSGSGSGSSSSKGAATSYSLDSRAIGLSVVGGLLGLLV